MQIGGLGFIQSIATSNNISQASEVGAFASLLTNYSQSNISDEQTITNQEKQAPSKNLLKDLIQMMNSTHISELNLISDQVDSLTGEEEIMKLVQTLLKLDGIDLKSSLTSFLKSLNLEKDVQDPFDREITNLIEELPNLDEDEAFMAFVQIIPFIQEDQIKIKQDEQFVGLVKSLKLYELLSSDISNANHMQVKKLLQKIGEKLEIQLKLDHSSSQRELLLKVFTPVVKGLQNQTQFNQSIQLETNISEPLISGGVQDELLSFQQVTKPEQLLILNSQTGKQVTVEQLIKQFEAILSKSQLTQAGGTQRLFIKLYPEHLGELRVELIQEKAGMIARLMTSTSTAKEILESQLQNLKQAFSAQNIQIERIEISNQLNNPERFISKDPEQQERRHHNEQEEREQEPEQSFMLTLEDTLLNIEV